MILSEAINIRKGTTDVTAVYVGTTLVWPLSALWTSASGLYNESAALETTHSVQRNSIDIPTLPLNTELHQYD